MENSRRRIENVAMALQRQMESSQQRQTKLQGISARKTICSQLETLEKRVIVKKNLAYLLL